jgi:hypothetical protein
MREFKSACFSVSSRCWLGRSSATVQNAQICLANEGISAIKPPMDTDKRLPEALLPPGTVLAPIHCYNDGIPLRICLILREKTEPEVSPFVLIRELPGSRVYLGAVCDAQARVQEWVEIWVQSLDLREVMFSSSQERLANYAFDQAWRAEHHRTLATLPERVIVTGMEEKNPAPLLIKRGRRPGDALFVPVERTNWQLCRDDALLESLGLPPYSTSPFRYLHSPKAAGPKTLLSTASDAPTNAHVQTIDRLKAVPEVTDIFNPQAGLIRVSRFSPFGLEDYLQVLEGRAWNGADADTCVMYQRGIYAELRAWSASPKGLPFLLHGGGNPAERLHEILLLKLSALLNTFTEVRAYVKARQLPLLNLSPSSFAVCLGEVGAPFPTFWTAKVVLVRPGQAYPLKIKSTQHNYFIRLGRIEPSPFLPEGLGAHSFGIGSVRLRNVLSEADGTVLEGTLVAEDYLGPDPHDLLWFKLPLGEERLEFYAHVYTAEAVGPKEARFRTVPAKVPDSVVSLLQRTSTFVKAPYEIWPLLSSPSDLHSLGILAIRTLLANSKSPLRKIVDDVLSLARLLGKQSPVEGPLRPKLKSLLDQEPKLLELVSPRGLLPSDQPSGLSGQHIHPDLWLDAITWLLRLFPGTGAHGYCQDFGDVSPLALETVFDRPIQELEALVFRLRSLLLRTNADNEEIARIVLKQIATV